MKTLSLIASHLSALFRRKKLDADMAEEMRQHLERQTQVNIAAGMSSDEARYAAQRQFGGVDQIKEIAREQRGWLWAENFSRDLRFAARSLAKTPGFSIVAMLIVTLGIGSATVMFSMVNALVLRPLALPEPERMVAIYETNLPRNVPFFSVSLPNYVDWRNRAQSWEGIAALMWHTMNLTGNGEPEVVQVKEVTANFFPTFGIPIVRGRNFFEEEESRVPRRSRSFRRLVGNAVSVEAAISSGVCFTSTVSRTQSLASLLPARCSRAISTWLFHF